MENFILGIVEEEEVEEQGGEGSEGFINNSPSALHCCIGCNSAQISGLTPCCIYTICLHRDSKATLRGRYDRGTLCAGGVLSALPEDPPRCSFDLLIMFN